MSYSWQSFWETPFAVGIIKITKTSSKGERVGSSRARPNCVSLDGLDPETGGTREYWIEKDLIQFFYKQGLLYKFHALKCVKEVMTSPAVVFEGLGREGQEEALCFAGLAGCSCSKAGNEIPPPSGKTFAVYIRKDGVIFRWDWELSENLTYPLNYRTRFGPQLWPKT